MPPISEERIRQIIREELGSLIKSDRFTFQKDLQIQDGRNIIIGATLGTRFGTNASQLIGFYNADPVAQRSHVADPSGGGTIDSQARTAIVSILANQEALGFHASS